RRLAPLRQRFETLTPREREVMAEVLKGRLNKQIAGDIGVSEVTVKAHRGQIMRKMKASSVLDLARMAEQLNFTPKTLQASEARARANTRERASRAAFAQDYGSDPKEPLLGGEGSLLRNQVCTHFAHGMVLGGRRRSRLY